MSALDVWPPSIADDGLGIVLEPGPYKRLAYHLVSFPLGLVGFLGVVLGVTVGLVLSVLLVGVGLLAGTVTFVRALVELERRLADALLGMSVPSPPALTGQPSGPIAYVRAALADEATQRAGAFVLIRFPLSVVQGTVAVGLTALSLALVTAPLHYDGGQIMQFGPWWHLHSLSEALLAVPVGLLLWAFSLHVFDLLGEFAKRPVDRLLGPGE